MCRSIKTLHNFAPPATDDEIRASALQFVLAFNHAVDQVTLAARELLDSLVSKAPSRDRDVEAAKGRARSAARFGASEGHAN